MTEELKQEINKEFNIERIRRKRDQAWDMSSLARQDGDHEDCSRRTQEAIAWSTRLSEILNA